MLSVFFVLGRFSRRKGEVRMDMAGRPDFDAFTAALLSQTQEAEALETAKLLYALDGYDCSAVSEHEGGRNQTYICRMDGENRYALRISAIGDRREEDYLAEAEFIRYLKENGAPVADVLPSVNGRLVERYENQGQIIYISLFMYAKGMLIADNGYRYRDGAPLSEYFYNTGKALGKIHRLSKTYRPVHRREGFFDKYSMDYIHRLIPDQYAELKQAISKRLDRFRDLPRDGDSFGLVHFDFSDGNYHIDMETGDLTVFDFDNCIYCWYMFDLANLWTHGVGWFQFEPDAAKRMEGMKRYFDTVLEGYKSETDVSEALLAQLPLFIDMVLIENIVDEFECCAREGEEVDEEDIEDAAECLIRDIPFAGFGEN
jgi:Ser/Thr protein kinase RdoA (MazF antagonist)